ncbi:MAG: hypothetical protein U0168_21620 [Nannocystaceae bacterium]
MIEHRTRARLTVEPREHACVVAEARVHQLHRDVGAAGEVRGAEDHAHGAFTQDLVQAEARCQHRAERSR